MKIGKAVKELPGTAARSKYQHIWDAVNALPNGNWLPVECANKSEAEKLVSNCTSGRRAHTRTKGNTVYLSKRAGELSAKEK